MYVSKSISVSGAHYEQPRLSERSSTRTRDSVHDEQSQKRVSRDDEGCKLPEVAPVEQQRSYEFEHWYGRVQVHVDSTAAASMTTLGAVFPRGSAS